MLHPLTTKRLIIGQVSVCLGCCCGRTDRGKPEVPVEWLKDQWRQRRLLKTVQLTISGCLGPCDLPNVIRIDYPAARIWLGRIEYFDQYREVVEWAAQSKTADRLLPLPKDLLTHTFDPFR